MGITISIALGEWSVVRYKGNIGVAPFYSPLAINGGT